MTVQRDGRGAVRLVKMARTMAALAAALLAVACGGSITDRGGTPGAPDGGAATDAAAPVAGCASNADCNGGYCVAGACCAAAEAVCGDACCAAGTICFASACVTPGELCYATGDCGAGRYCEASLGPSDAPTQTVDPGHACVQPTPQAGRCLDLPPRCADGAPPTDDCLPACEVRPAVGNLTAVAEWSWGEQTAVEHPDFVDVWSTPVIGRVTDSNCDGKVDELDPPNVIFVSGNGQGTCCQCTTGELGECKTGVLRVLDGASGKEIWSLRKASADSVGFAGMSLALGDVDRDGRVEIAAMTGEGHVVLIDGTGKIVGVSDKPVPGHEPKSFGWGGGLAIADMNRDGAPEIAFGSTVFTTQGGGLTLKFTGKGGIGGSSVARALSTFVDLDGDGDLELLAGNSAYRWDGSDLWKTEHFPDGFPAVGDFDLDGRPEVVMVAGGKLWIVEAATGVALAGPLTLPGDGSGGPPTVADFDGDGHPEVGVAKANFYSVTEVDLAAKALSVRWQQLNHDFSSSVTGSTVFDFEGDGSAEVIYNDECFLWVYDGKTGAVRFATPTTSFTGTEASLVADVDGDGRAEMVMVANGASPDNWKCTKAPWNEPDAELNRPAWTPPPGASAHRGITLWGDAHNAWVGTRTLWNQHTYHVSNICDSRDSACAGAANVYGAIPAGEAANWTLPWLNNFRQNVQDRGIFDAPDATVTLRVSCEAPLTVTPTVRNLGLAPLPAGVKVGIYVQRADGEQLLAEVQTATALFPGQAAALAYVTRPLDGVKQEDTFVARVLGDEGTFQECRADNNDSQPARSPCLLR